MSEFSLASDVTQANEGIRPSSLSCAGGSEEGVRKNKPVDTELMQRAGAAGAKASERATAADLSKYKTDFEKDIEWIDTRGGGEIRVRLGRIKPMKDDPAHSLIPETPSPKPRVGSGGAQPPQEENEAPIPGRSEVPPGGIFKGRSLMRTPPPTIPTGTQVGTSEGDSGQATMAIHTVDLEEPSCMGEDQLGLGPETFKRLVQRELVVSIDRCSGAEEYPRQRANSASMVERGSKDPGLGLNKEALSRATVMTQLSLGAKAKVREIQTGGTVLDAGPDYHPPTQLSRAVGLLSEILRDCKRATKDFSERKASSKVASVKWLLEFLGKVTRRGEKAESLVAEVLATGEIARWKEAPNKRTEDRGVQCTLLADGEDGGSLPQFAPSIGEAQGPPAAEPGKDQSQEGVDKHKQQKAKRPRTSPSPRQEANKKRAFDGTVECEPNQVNVRGKRTGLTEPEVLMDNVQVGRGLSGGNMTPSGDGGRQPVGISEETERMVKSKGQSRRDRREAKRKDLQAQRAQQECPLQSQRQQPQRGPMQTWQQQQEVYLQQRTTMQNGPQPQIEQGQGGQRHMTQTYAEIARVPAQGVISAPQKTRDRPKVRKRPEAILVKVVPPQTYIEVYRTLVTKGKDVLKAISAMRRTRAGHILLELKKEAETPIIMSDLQRLVGTEFAISALQDKTALEVREVCPLADTSSLGEDLGRALKVDPGLIMVKSLRMGPGGKQVAVVEVPTNLLGQNLDRIRFRSGLSMARIRALQKSTRCFRCHNLGHLARDCRDDIAGAERCRKCGEMGHSIASCGNAPRCIICVGRGLEGSRVAHVTASLACPAGRKIQASGGRRIGTS